VPPRSRWLLVASVLAVWVVWGSTYFAIRLTLATMPPFRMAGMRLVSAGLVLLAISRARGLRWPTRAEWAACGRIGALMFVGGNGSVVFAEQTVSSGLVAILVGAVPVYTAGIGIAYGKRATRREWLGILLGVGGVVILNAGGELRGNPWMAVVLGAGSAAWALGSVQGHVSPMPPGAMASGAQMLAGGLALGLLSLATGEHSVAPLTTESLLAFLYLVTFGSLVAFSAYGYLLRNASLPLATSYAYVNPVVAVLLGGWLGGEHLDPTGWAGLAVILLGVGLVTRAPRGAPHAALGDG
jgi:drug/metabolite transporter (DMT)-like permease